MKNFTYLIVLLTLILSCNKESDVSIPTKRQETAPLWVKFSELDHNFNTNTIYNPQPTDIRTYGYGEIIEYDFYIDNPIYPKLQVEIADYYNDANRGTDTIYSVHIYIEEALTLNREDGYVMTFKGSGLIPFPEFDSLHQLSYESPIISPFSDTLKDEVFEGTDTQFFLPEDSVNLRDTTLQWSNKADDNKILSHFLNIGFYAHRNHLYQVKSNDDPNSFALHHDYHHGIMGMGNKFFVFRWLNNSEQDEYYYGWMELSLTKKREFTIHKVVYQID